jgi:acyl-coenzyme A synthetase/AMP-(fatty) acid ligase
VQTSLGFELLDRHVVAGRAEHTACTDADGSMTFAKLTERAAELAGGLAMLGVEPGESVRIDLSPGNVLVTAVCAVIRLGAVPGASADTLIAEFDGEVRVRRGEHDLDLTLVQRAGRAQPAPSLTHDPDGYRDAAVGEFGDIVETLLSGASVV